MENLPLLEKESLEILKQLEFSCTYVGPSRERSEKEVEIPINDIKLTAFLKIPGKLEKVEQFLQDKGLNFSTSFDLIKRPFKSLDGAIMHDTVTGVIKGESIKTIQAIIHKLIKRFSQKQQEEQSVAQATGHFDYNQEILLKNIKIKIKGNTICKGSIKPKKVFNSTEMTLVYFLHDEFIKNNEKCFLSKVLAEKFIKKETYIDNIVTHINKIFKKTISEVTTSNIKLIEYKKGHGFHLNPKLFM